MLMKMYGTMPRKLLGIELTYCFGRWYLYFCIHRALLGYEEKTITVAKTGVEYEQLLGEFNDDERSFAFVRMITGDEMSKRAKFALITWCGANVSPMKKANLTVDKSLVKDIISVC